MSVSGTSALRARDAARTRARAAFLADSADGAAHDVVATLVPALGSWCEVTLWEGGEFRTTAVRGSQGPSAESPTEWFPEFERRREQVVLGGGPSVLRREGEPAVCLLAAIRGPGESLGTVALVTDVDDVELADHLGVVEHVAALAAAAIGRAQLRGRAHDAARRTQRVASQLHQLLAASIAIGGLQDEDEIVASVGQRVRSVFHGDLAVVTLVGDAGVPTCVAAAGVGRPEHVDPRYATDTLGLPTTALASVAAGVQGQWLLAPILARRGESQGSLAVRRTDVPFEDDDVEVATLLAQTATAALASARLHRTVARSEERLRVLVDAAPVAIVETDLAGAVQWWNRSATELFGWADQLADGGVDHRFPDGAVEVLREAWDDALQGSIVVGRDVVGVDVNARRRDLTVSVAALPATAGHAGGVLTVVEDVTDRHQLMEELRHAQRMDVIGQLSSSVAHDFNNLLTLIAGYAELLATDLEGDERAEQLVIDIQATTSRAATLTGKLLTMGRKKLPTPVVFSPADSVRTIGEVLDRIVGPDVQLVLELDDGAGNVRSDPDQFEQAIMNLATNARDAMPEGGTLRIVISPVPVAAGEAGRVRITVADTGEGMDEATMARCFEPLFTTKGPSHGTGLGLPAARRVVTEAGGTIHCESAVGVGTTFEILLPSVDEAVEIAEPTVGPPRRRGGASVILAEDEDGIRELVERILLHNDYEVHISGSAEEALKVAGDLGDRVDVLVSDVVLGGMSGAELARDLQARWPELLVVLMSGNVDESVLEELRPGTAAFLAKPFRPSELLEVVERLLAAKEEQRAES